MQRLCLLFDFCIVLCDPQQLWAGLTIVLADVGVVVDVVGAGVGVGVGVGMCVVDVGIAAVAVVTINLEGDHGEEIGRKLFPIVSIAVVAIVVVVVVVGSCRDCDCCVCCWWLWSWRIRRWRALSDSIL